jgi:DNA topoisomerase-1
MKLIIVESPHKSQTIGKFLGKEYKVMASKGHIRDLASRGPMGLGVDVEHGFKPTYEISADKQSTVRELKAAVKKADEVYLATDPDREGEAISWHLAQVLGLDIKTTKRLEFHEITKPAILKALANPRTIDMELVESQETRRIIDRLMGYRLSYLLQKKIKSRSAGRVQSVVLKFIVDREKEIKEFVPVEYWTIQGEFASGDGVLKASLSQYQEKPIQIHSEAEADKVLSELPETFSVKNVKVEETKREPRPPFITSTLQQAAFAQFHFSTRRTQSIAQHLYEGEEVEGQSMGLITYMRTDSTRLAEEFISSAHGYIASQYGKDYIGYAHMQKADKNIQDAHEAIRPTDINMTPARVKEYLSNDEFKLYSLIYDRAVASLMSPRRDKVTTLVITGNGYDFSASSSSNLFEGYHKVYGKYEAKEEKVSLPDFKTGDKLVKDKVEKEQHFTKAPARYNEGKVVKLMQDNGIGRPSTYASTISTLLTRGYVESQKGSLVPTEQGVLTEEKLADNFQKYMDATYTANMENALDSIAEGKTDKNTLLNDFWGEFQNYFEAAEKNMEKIQPKIVEGRVCPKCGSPLVMRHGKYGDFVGCSNYPKCDYIEKEKPQVLEDKICPKCGKPLVKRVGKKGEFIGCSGYPHCNYMESLDGKPLVQEKKEVVIPEDAPLCPRCKTGHLIEKKSRWGKTFIGCSNYPKCRYIQKEDEKKK